MIFSRNLLKSQCYFYPISNQTGRPLPGSQVSEEGAGKVDAKYQGEGAREEVWGYMGEARLDMYLFGL